MSGFHIGSCLSVIFDLASFDNDDVSMTKAKNAIFFPNTKKIMKVFVNLMSFSNQIWQCLYKSVTFANCKISRVLWRAIVDHHGHLVKCICLEDYQVHEQ